MTSAVMRFREDVTVYDGQSLRAIHADLDEAERVMLRRFDAWRVGKTLLDVSLTRFVTRNADDSPFYVYLTVLYEE